MFGMAHSRRMGVISSTLPGLSRGGARTDVENEERERKREALEEKKDVGLNI